MITTICLIFGGNEPDMGYSFRTKALQFEPATQAPAEVCSKITYQRQKTTVSLPPAPVVDLIGAQPASLWVEKTFGFVPAPKQAQVLDSESKYIILCCNRQWGKTTAIALKALHRCLKTPGLNIVVISRSLEQAALLIEKFSDYAVELGYRVRRVLGRRFSFKLPNGSQIRAVPHNETTSAGRTANVLIVDEAARVCDKVYDTVSAFVSRSHGALWLLSTPKGQVGFFYNFWHNQDQSWQRIFSNVDECPDLDPDYLRMKKIANPTAYRQDFECQFIQPDGSLTTREFVERIVFTPEEARLRGL